MTLQRLACLLLLLPALSYADTITFQMRSNAEYSVALEFTSQDRDHQWPGNDKAYKIDDFEIHRYKLKCVTGEQICYGAWVEGDDTQYWGVGMNNSQRCSDCCYVCNGGSKVQLINLNE
jgi:hypothetical protein